MAGLASIENGKKGGRPKGSKAPITLRIEAARQILIQSYIDNIKPINDALIKKAKRGDMVALKELHDRVYGRSLQPISADVKSSLSISFDPTFNATSNSSQ